MNEALHCSVTRREGGHNETVFVEADDILARFCTSVAHIAICKTTSRAALVLSLFVIWLLCRTFATYFFIRQRSCKAISKMT